MKIFFLVLKPAMLSLVFIVANGQANAQSSTSSVTEDPQKLYNVIIYHDSLFWNTYNTCDLDKLQTFFTEDLEFYHDKGGLTTNLVSFMEGMKNGMCSNENWVLRREVVEGSLDVYPIPDYGALLTGEHVFYIRENDKKERLHGKARFLHVWQFKNNEWKMSRVVSYAHNPVAYESQKTEISLPDDVLMQFVGNYKSPEKGIVSITKDENRLSLQADEFRVTLYPESEDTFFMKERDIQFKFIKDANDKILKVIVIENEETVDEAIKVN